MGQRRPFSYTEEFYLIHIDTPPSRRWNIIPHNLSTDCTEWLPFYCTIQQSHSWAYIQQKKKTRNLKSHMYPNVYYILTRAKTGKQPNCPSTDE